MSLLRVITRKDERIVDTFGIARFAGLAGSVFRVVVEGLGLCAEIDALDDAVEHGSLRLGGFLLAKSFAQSWSRESIRNIGVAGDADCLVVFLRGRPGLPPDFATVEVFGGCDLVPCCIRACRSLCVRGDRGR